MSMIGPSRPSAILISGCALPKESSRLHMQVRVCLNGMLALLWRLSTQHLMTELEHRPSHALTYRLPATLEGTDEAHEPLQC